MPRYPSVFESQIGDPAELSMDSRPDIDPADVWYRSPAISYVMLVLVKTFVRGLRERLHTTLLIKSVLSAVDMSDQVMILYGML